jgi:hypothetical protein
MLSPNSSRRSAAISISVGLAVIDHPPRLSLKQEEGG